MRSWIKTITNLEGVRPAAAHLFDDRIGHRMACQQEGRDRRRDRGHDLGDPFLGDDARTARHLRDKAQCGGAKPRGQASFLDGTDAANFYTSHSGHAGIAELDLGKLKRSPMSVHVSRFYCRYSAPPLCPANLNL